MCSTLEDDTGGIDTCQEGSDLLFQATASGLIVKSDDKHSYVLTAAHFCDVTLSIESFYPSEAIDSEMWVSTTSETNSIGDVVLFDHDSDLCLIRTKVHKKAKTIEFSEMPDIGDKIYAISSPLNISENGVLLHFEGFFSGCDPYGLCFYTIPATHGSSGSIVFNRSGKAIGMIQMIPSEFDSVSMGAGYHDIKKFLKKAESMLDVKFSI
tara:strand:+ start:519 stop:1148 length:630 start_codon:yes stop_codon:yes gene_type:complete